MRKSTYFLLFLMIMTCFFSCKNDKGDSSSAGQEVVWAKRTHFKVEFNSPDEEIETIAMKDRELMDMILEAVEKGERKAYDFTTYELLSKEKVADIFVKHDTILVADPVTEKEVMKPIENPLNRPEVKKFRVKQEWYFDKKNFKMNSKIIAMAPVESIYNSDGSFRGDLPLFWVYFEGEPQIAKKP